jgi:Tfp pilus assembly protein FimT
LAYSLPFRRRCARESGHSIATGELFRASAGFTLIEVLTILVLLGIITALAAPRIDFQRFQIAGAMQSVGSTLMVAQRGAVQEHHNVVVAFDVAGSRLRIHSDTNNDLVIGEGEYVRYEPLGEYVRFGRGGAVPFFAVDQPVTFSLLQDGLPAVVFYRNGAASEEGGFYLTSTRALNQSGFGRDTRALRIGRSTGRPTWFRHVPPLWKQEF